MSPQIKSLSLDSLKSVHVNQRNKLPYICVIYFAIDVSGSVQYVGQTTNLRQRIAVHHRLEEFKRMNLSIAWMEVSDPQLLLEIEQALINHFDPPLNNQAVKFGQVDIKVFIPSETKKLYHALCLSEDIKMSEDLRSYILYRCNGEVEIVSPETIIGRILALTEKPTILQIDLWSRQCGLSQQVLTELCDRLFQPKQSS